MAVQGTTIGTMFGLTAALTTNGTLVGNIVQVDTAPELSRTAVESTHTASTDGWKTFIAGDMKDGGELALTCQYNTQLDYAALFAAGCDTITITFPKRAATCGGTVAATAATLAFPVVFQRLSPVWNFDDMAVITLRFKVAGKPTYVAAQTA